MAYTAWSVVFGEQPTAAKWNQLGANDAGFKDGTNIDALAITNAKLANSAIAWGKNDFTTHPLMKLNANSDTGLSSSGATIVLNVTEVTRGSGLTKTGSTIVIGSGITLVRVTGAIPVENFSTSTYAFGGIAKNGARIAQTLMPSTVGFAFATVSSIFAVTNGDAISLTADVGAGTASVKGTTRPVFLVVEAIG